MKNKIKTSLKQFITEQVRELSLDNVVLTCYAANCGRGDCSVEIWDNIIKNIKNGLNTKSN
jgi:hypothetical protein